MSNAPPALEPRIAKALSHPLRMQILTILSQRVASPVELSGELEVPLNNLSYHVRTLLDLGCVELVRTEPRRGTLEHYSRAIERPILSEESWSAIPRPVRRSIADGVLTQIARDLSSAAARGGFDRENIHLTRTPIAVDDEGFAELEGLMSEVLDRAMQIQAESAARVNTRKAGDDAAADTFSANVVMMLFEQPPPRRKARKGR